MNSSINNTSVEENQQKNNISHKDTVKTRIKSRTVISKKQKQSQQDDNSSNQNSKLQVISSDRFKNLLSKFENIAKDSKKNQIPGKFNEFADYDIPGIRKTANNNDKIDLKSIQSKFQSNESDQLNKQDGLKMNDATKQDELITNNKPIIEVKLGPSVKENILKIEKNLNVTDTTKTRERKSTVPNRNSNMIRALKQGDLEIKYEEFYSHDIGEKSINFERNTENQNENNDNSDLDYDTDEEQEIEDVEDPEVKIEENIDLNNRENRIGNIGLNNTEGFYKEIPKEDIVVKSEEKISKLFPTSSGLNKEMKIIEEDKEIDEVDLIQEEMLPNQKLESNDDKFISQSLENEIKDPEILNSNSIENFNENGQIEENETENFDLKYETPEKKEYSDNLNTIESNESNQIIKYNENQESPKKNHYDSIKNPYSPIENQTINFSSEKKESLLQPRFINKTKEIKDPNIIEKEDNTEKNTNPAMKLNLPSIHFDDKDVACFTFEGRKQKDEDEICFEGEEIGDDFEYSTAIMTRSKIR